MNDMHKAIAIENSSELENLILTKAAQRFYSRGERERFDLFPFYSILVSTGTNKNTDAFDPIELWKAKNSPVDKPVNIGHKQTNIIGHIIDNIAVGEDLKPIPDDTEECNLPNKLHIITASVIYKIWEDPKIQAEVNKIIDKVSKGEIYVSMECLFKDFAYLLTSASGEQRVIQRSPETSSLTKYLRQYKGPGKIHNYSLARLLKNITFSAVGIVENPANPESTISNNFDLFSGVASNNADDSVYIKIDSNKLENTMADVVAVNIEDSAKYKTLSSDYIELTKSNDGLNKTIADLTKELNETKTALASSDEKVKKMEKEKADDTSDTETEMASLKESVSKLQAEVDDLKKEKAGLATANDAMTATIEEYKKASRAAALMAVDSTLTKEKAEQSVASFSELSDTGFASMVEMMRTYSSKAPREVTAESILNNAVAEEAPNLGAKAEDAINKTAADIKNFYKSTKVNPKASKE